MPARGRARVILRLPKPSYLAGMLYSFVLIAVLALGSIQSKANEGCCKHTLPPRKHVLLVLPDNLGFEGQMDVALLMRRDLYEADMDRVELYTESLDLMRLKSAVSDEEFADIFRKKYRNVKMDLLVAVQRPVLEFLVAHRAELFPGAPIVYGMIPKNYPADTTRIPGVTGSLEPTDFDKTVELALQLQPQTRQVVVISGVSARDRWLQWIARQQLARYQDKLDLEYWEGLTPNEVKERLRNAGPNTVAYFIAEYRDRMDHSYSGSDFLEKIATDSAAPIYTLSSTMLGRGTIGGYVYDPQDATRQMAEQARAILGGKSADELPIQEGKMHAQLDDRELKRWGIPESRVPAGAAVMFRAPTMWEKYRRYVEALAVFICVETGLVVLLLAQIKRKNRAQAMLERRFALERVVTDYSERLAHCPAAEVDGVIRSGLEAIRSAEEADLAVWLLLEEGDERGVCVESELQAARPGMETGGNFWLAEKLPALTETMRRGECVAVPRVSAMAEDLWEGKAYLEGKGVKSLLVVPPGAEVDVRGALVIVATNRERTWGGALEARLRVLGNLFANAIGRKGVERQLAEKQEWLTMTLEASMTALWELDVRTGRVRWSQRHSTLFGKEPVELEASYQKFLELIPQEDRRDLYQRAIALLQNEDGKDEIVTEWRFHEPGGGVKWLLFRGQVFRDEKGRPLRLRGVNVDITDLKEAKMELMQLTERLIRAQEEERQRLARELHDDIGQRLSLLIIELDRLKHQLPVTMREERDQVGGALAEANELATDIHALSHQLHSSKLQHLGLNSALRELCMQMSRQHGLEVNLTTRAIPPNLNEEKSLCLYRVAQEALKNAVKHSGTEKIEINVEGQAGALEMRVRDYGCGFDANRCDAGLGLASMRERLRMAGGSLEVRSEIGRGTEIVMRVPAEKMVITATNTQEARAAASAGD